MDSQTLELNLTQDEMGIISKFRTALEIRINTLQKAPGTKPLPLDEMRTLSKGEW